MEKYYSDLKISTGKNRRQSNFWAIFILLYCIAFINLAACSDPPVKTYEKTFYSMGTIVEIKVRSEDSLLAMQAINSAVKEIKRLDEKYSTYKVDNFIYNLNNDTSHSIRIDTETFNLLKISDRINRLTKGKFDPAIGRVIDILGFKQGTPEEVDTTVITDAILQNGWKYVELKKPDTLIRKRPVKFNLGGIVKGYAVDKMLEKIKAIGIKEAYVNAGGEIGLLEGDWEIGIQHPRKPDELLAVLKLNNSCIATSGDYEQYVEKSNNRITHIIDPEIGITSQFNQSVTVISDSTIVADALATGLFLLDAETGIKIINSLSNIEAIIVDPAGRVFKTPGVGKLIR